MSKPTQLAPIYLLDGGLGTTLADNHAITFDDTTPLWSSQLLLTSQPTLLAAQRSFATAGADVILTATYQASYEGFVRSGVLDERVAGRYMRDAVGIARESFEGRKEGLVALSLGAYGAIMVPGQEYTGDYDEERRSVEGLRRWHLKRLRGFYAHGEDDELEDRERRTCWGNINLVAFETLPLLEEVEAVRKVMGDVSSYVGDQGNKEFWITCVFPGDANTLPDGSSVQEIVKTMLTRKKGSTLPMGIGLNCTNILKVESLVMEFENAVKDMVEAGEVDEWPSLVLYPDGTNGEVYNTKTKFWEMKGSSREFSWDQILFDIVRKTGQRGSWKIIYVGGCCKTTPVEITKLYDRIYRRSESLVIEEQS